MDSSVRIKNILSSLNIPSEDFILVSKKPTRFTEISMYFEFCWAMKLPTHNKIKFGNLNNVATYVYEIRLRLESYSDQEIIENLKNDLRTIKEGIIQVITNNNGDRPHIVCYLKHNDKDNFHEVDLK